MNTMQFIENKMFDEIEVGQSAELVRTLKREDAGVVLGARLPIMLTSRTDDMLCRLASTALVQLYVRRRAGAVAWS